MQNLINLALVNIAAFLLLSSKYLKCAGHTVRNVPTHLPPLPIMFLMAPNVIYMVEVGGTPWLVSTLVDGCFK